ncbi:MAG: cob(I)yrinic acid a,c-diamide adenosyltransferase [Candidatus ainarchaeum sp.]|nr:cob(I)yrinic acid a,c-diamide adenosyltransferase [Candidatus ainarchaeum sp.]
MAIYTKFGDQGQTSLLGGSVVAKDDPRVEAYGAVDELNAALGIVVAFGDIGDVNASLLCIQKDLFVIGAELAGGKKHLSPSRVSDLEREIDTLWPELPPLKHFIIPGGSKTASLIHLARTVCRRAERQVVLLSNVEKKKVNPNIITYLNRLGDLLFTQARYVNYKKRKEEAVWRG